MITSFYKHPVEMAVNSLIGSDLVYAILDLSPAAGACYTLCTALGELFHHTNSRCGFDPAREERLAAMLVFRDVHRDTE